MSVKSGSLTTASRLSSFMDITTPTGTKLTAMEKMIDALSDFIRVYTGITFKKTTYTQEEYNTEEGDILNLKHWPALSSETFLLEKRTSVLNEDDWETVDSEYYHVDYAAGIIYGAQGVQFRQTIRGYRVTYTAGYDFDNSTTFLSDTNAGDIELAIWMLGEAMWNKRKGGSGIERESIGDYSVTYKKALLENEDVKAILDKYCLNTELGVITPYQS